ncbi:MAG: polysaccharide biosynthesis C-terminal domain-containing protein [Candidatus Bathyarchaeia archaeon]
MQFAGYAIFAAKIVSVATGFFFQFMLARALLGNPATSPQYGIYFNIADMMFYFTMFSSVIPFWVMRYFARGKEGAVKTGLAMSAIISIISTVIYLALIPFILPALNITVDFLPIYLAAAVQITELISIGIYEALLQAYKPHAVGYGLLFQQVCKVAVGYVLIVQLGQPLAGAVVAAGISLGVQVIYYQRLLAHELKQRVHWDYVKVWLKSSLANIYYVVGSQLALAVFILLLIFGTKDGRGIYGAAAQIASIITYSSFLAFALYPKLLAEKKREDITTSLKMVFMFALPMAAGAIALADSYMMLLSPENPAEFTLYQQGYIVIIVLALDALITVAGTLFSSVVYGFESVDENERITFRQLIKSKLFLAFTLPYVQAALTLPVTYYVLTTYALNQPLQAAFSVCVISTVVHVITFAMLYAIVRKMTTVAIPWKSIAKYLFASIVMGLVLFLPQPHPNRISTTLIMTAVGGVVYLAVLWAIDKEAREFPRNVVREVRKILKR